MCSRLPMAAKWSSGKAGPHLNDWYEQRVQVDESRVRKRCVCMQSVCFVSSPSGAQLYSPSLIDEAFSPLIVFFSQPHLAISHPLLVS